MSKLKTRSVSTRGEIFKVNNRHQNDFKGVLSGSIQFLATESPLKMMKMLISLLSLFRSQDI